MARFVWDRHAGEWVDASLFRRGGAPGAGPNVISDGLDGLWNPADGQRYDSKSAYYRTMRAHGCEVDDRRYEPRVPEYRSTGLRGDIRRAMDAHGL